MATMAYHADATDLTDKEILTWEGFGDAARELSQAVVDSGFEARRSSRSPAVASPLLVR